MTESDEPEWSLAAAAYDAIASRYDRVPEENRINRHMRRLSLARLLATFRPSFRVLELGCGTGEEALALAAQEVRIVGVDPSEKMVGLARRKARARGLEDRVTFLRAAACDLPRVVAQIDPPFDGAYASFSLAYEPNLAPVAAALHALLRPRSVFLASVPSRVCLVEFLLALGSARPSYAGRRLRSWHGHKVGDAIVPLRTYTPRTLARVMAPHFVLRRTEALPSVVPPPYMNRWYGRLDGFADALERFDTVVRTRFPFRLVGDHFLAELQRTP